MQNLTTLTRILHVFDWRSPMDRRAWTCGRTRPWQRVKQRQRALALGTVQCMYSIVEGITTKNSSSPGELMGFYLLFTQLRSVACGLCPAGPRTVRKGKKDILNSLFPVSVLKLSSGCGLCPG
jgi:hypothetical protein